MLIYLVPGAPRPNVFFTVALPDPCEHVPLPAGWSNQLRMLHAEELDVPPTLHALDKATWLISIITEVTFDLTALTVSCTFVDGPSMEWPLADAQCLQTLEDILADVMQATEESERAREADAEPPRPEPIPLPIATPAAKPVKHKKQRSLFMSLVSSINKLALNMSDGPSHASPLHRPRAPPPSIPLPPPPREASPPRPFIPSFLPPSRKSQLERIPRPPPAIFYQHRARSALVECFRTAVVPVLRQRLSPGGFRRWAATNMLRRTEDQMAALVHDAGGLRESVDLLREPLPSPSRGCSSPGFDDDNDEESLTDTASTDTDESSVHTPVDSPSNSPFATIRTTSSGYSKSSRQQVPRSPSPPGFSPEDLATYTVLSAHCMRLRDVISRAENAQLDIEHEERAFLAILEVKSRRRAWSNRRFLGGARQAGIGFATPFTSSPLARFPAVTPETIAVSRARREARPKELEVCTVEMSVATLFPVSEEEEDDPFVVKPERAFAHREGDYPLPSVEDAPLARPPARTRTVSMHIDLMPPDSPRPQHASLPAQRITVNVKPVALEPQTKYPLFADEVDDPARVSADDSAEFTLAMDLPHPPTFSRGRSRSSPWDTSFCR